MYKIYFLEVEEEDEPRLRELTKRYDIEIFPNAMDEDEIIEKCRGCRIERQIYRAEHIHLREEGGYFF